jgi:class 3 adenylate cyclase
MVGRRLTAIFAADFAGYSALMGGNEVDTVAALKGHQSIILPMVAGYGGKVIDIAGDGIFAEFPSVFNAVKCAVAIQETMLERNASVPVDRQMQLRIGINQGDILFDEERIYGDGVNVAARLESICEPGGICISGKVYDEIKGRFEIQYEDLGVQNLKNIEIPVRTFRINVAGSPGSKRSRGAKFTLLPTRSRAVVYAVMMAILITSGIGWWAFAPPRIMQTNLVSKSAEPINVASSRDTLSDVQRGALDVQAFDGVWEFSATGGQYCPLKSVTFRRRIMGGIIMSGEGQKIGFINRDGSFQFSNPSLASPTIIVESRGNMNGSTGEGSYAGVGSLCQGTYQIRLIGKL